MAAGTKHIHSHVSVLFFKYRYFDLITRDYIVNSLVVILKNVISVDANIFRKSLHLSNLVIANRLKCS